MNSDVTLRDLASPSFVGVSESDSAVGTVGLMADDGADTAVVLRGDRPVGSVTATDLLSLVASGTDLSTTAVGETAAMDDPPPVLSAGDGPDAAAAALANGARLVLVSDGDELLGTVGPRDLVAARGTFGGEGNAGPTHEGSVESGVEPGTAPGSLAAEATSFDGGTSGGADLAGEAGVPDSGDEATAVAGGAGDGTGQGICEGCGDFAGELSGAGGKLLCQNCRGL